MSKKIIECRDASKVFYTERGPVEVLEHIDLDVYENELLVLFGPGQCGKSTFINCMSGLEIASGGEVLVNGKKVEKPGPDRGVVFQRTALFPWLTVMGNVEYGPKCAGMSKKERREKAQYYIDLVGLTGFENAYPSKLSGGMQQRVGIAGAMLLNPEVLFADEPTSALDAAVQKQVIDEMLLVRRTFGTAIILVSHNIGVIRAVADKVLVMKNGETVEYGEAEKVLTNPGEAYTKQLLAAVPHVRRA